MPETPLANLTANLQRALPPAPRNWIVKRAPWLVFLALLVLVAWLGARLTWQLTGSSAPVPPPPPAGQASSRGVGQSALADRVASAHLFGTAAAPGASAPGAQNAPETTLDLKLIGVAAGTEGTQSRAIIASGSRHEENTYAVGDSLPGGAVIRTILPDRVLIAHQGRLETLSLPIAGTSVLAASMDFGPSEAIDLGDGSDFGSGGAAHANPRPTLQHPQSVTTRYLRWRPHLKDGKQEGVTVDPGPNPELFQRAGLKPGDVIESINGTKLDSRMNILRGLSGLSGTAHLVVLRDGKQIPITVDFGSLSSGG